eukprot:scaffold6267_cov106-Isochrysis_galbana.AAC.3
MTKHVALAATEPRATSHGATHSTQHNTTATSCICPTTARHLVPHITSGRRGVGWVQCRRVPCRKARLRSPV